MELMDKQIIAVMVEWYFKDSDDNLIKNNQFNRAVECCNILMHYLKRKSMHLSPLFSAKIFSLISRVYTMVDKPQALIKSDFWLTLDFGFKCLATLVNLIVQLFIRHNLWQQADNFVKKCKFPESTSNSQQARYSYNCGSICMVHREYRDALKHFSNHYFKLSAVKLGSQQLFTHYIQQNADFYIGDKTAAVVFRLHHNVLKTALLKLSISYSSISLADVARKLQLESKDVEFIVAKAIKDGIINAVIDHTMGIVNFTVPHFNNISQNPDDVYNTQKSRKLIQSRSNECYKLYSKFMASMTYPKSAYTFDTKVEESAENLSDLEYLLRTYEEDSF
ncbi:hypothetical protein MXB_5375 [Myxobolus squamalis]|nr:hypothetical protein MXB_5375 [Myxobolus squamalis]